jgi:Spy/CpxP family protein refolding chaperone
MSMPARGKIIVYMVALFVAGGICGAMVASRMAANAQTLIVNRAPEIAVKIQNKLTTRLALTPEQLAKIQPLIEKTSEELEASHRDCLKRISLAIDNLHVGLCPVLTPEQKPMLTALDEERRESMWQKFHYQIETTNSTVRQ